MDLESVLEHLEGSSERSAAAKFSFFVTREVLKRVLAFGWPLGRLLGGIWKHFGLLRVAFL